MTPFRAPIDDILLAISATRTDDAFDQDLADEILNHFARFADEVIAPIDEIGDRQGCRLEDGRVKLPDPFLSAYQSYCDQGWHTLSLPVEYDGQGVPALIAGAVSEMLAGACHSFQMITGLVPGAAGVIAQFGEDDQRRKWLPALSSGKYLATMCLTEPQAGSDLSEIRTVARQDAKGNWTLHGEKIFISGGDQNLSEHILHLVLARTGGLEDGVRGLTLFLCPSEQQNGQSNAITVPRIEEKMGLHASPTCQVVFDGAQAEAIGPIGKGLACMFTMMNHARLDVALQGVAHASRAHQIAAQYASERTQGRDPQTRSPVRITQHYDVARMLARQDMLAMTARLMAYHALSLVEDDEHAALLDFLTPICKSFCTDAGVESAQLGIQILGGYGYLREYRVEQTLRDARICQIYEGTNGIHALSLASRLVRHNEGASASAFEKMIADVINISQPSDTLLSDLLSQWRKMTTMAVKITNPAKHAPDYMTICTLSYAVAVWENYIKKMPARENKRWSTLHAAVVTWAKRELAAISQI